jgi:hypothetical protein
MDKDKRVSAACPICHEGELRRMAGPPEWYLLPAATLGLPDDDEKRVGRGMPVGISVCSRCEYVALFLPPAVDAPEGSGGVGVREPRRPTPGGDADAVEVDPEEAAERPQ